MMITVNYISKMMEEGDDENLIKSKIQKSN